MRIGIKKAQGMLKNKEISLVELTQQYIQKAGEHKNLNLFITETFDQALKFAKENCDNLDYLEKPLAGTIMGFKDVFCTKGVRTTAASKILENFTPAYESTTTKRLNDAGVVSIGKLNMDEFAMGSTNTNSYFGHSYNPLLREGDPTLLVPGGSSGASAAAVAADVVIAATGSDTGGSVRQPASYCGVVGLKPCYGRCSRFGIVAYGSSLDVPGILTHNVEDAGLLLQQIAGLDLNDSTTIDEAVPNFSEFLESSAKGRKIGVIKELVEFNLPDHILKCYENAKKVMEEAGVELKEVSIPHIKDSLAAYYIIAPAEAASNLSRYDGVRYTHRAKDIKNLEELYTKTRTEGFGDEVKLRIMVGNFVLSSGYYDAYYNKAQYLRALIAKEFKEALKEVDCLLTPTTPNVAFEANNLPTDPVEIYLNDILTVCANIAGTGALSVPGGRGEYNLPVGMQLMGFYESRLLQYGRIIEKSC